MRKFTFKAAFVAAVALLGATSLKAQVTLMYPDATPAASFTTIQLAYDAIDFAAHAGAHTIQIDATPTAEVYPITLGAKTDASATNSVTIKPATGVKVNIGPANQTVIATVTGTTFTANTTAPANVTEDVDLTGIITSGTFSQIAVGSYISGIGTYTSNTFKTVTAVDAATNKITAAIGAFTATSIAGNKLYVGPAQTIAVKFNGASYVTIDGVSRTDASTGLTIQNPNNIYAQTIYFTGTSTYNTVTNCIIRGANQTGAWNNGFCGTVYFNGSHHNTITNNDVCDMNDANIPMPINAFWMTGTGVNFENTISSNNIYNVSNNFSPNGNTGFFQFGSTSNTSSYNINVLNNRIYWTKEATFKSEFFVIGMGPSMNGLGNRFEGNIIGWQADGVTRAVIKSTSTALTFNGLAVKNATVKNNTIGGLNLDMKVFLGFKINAHNAAATSGTIIPNASADDICYKNTVKDITVNATATGANAYGLFLAQTCPFPVNIKENVIENITIASPTADNTCTLQGIYFDGTTTTNSMSCVGNTLSNLTAGDANSTAANGIIGLRPGANANLIEKNLIYNLNVINKALTTTSTVKAMQIYAGIGTGMIIKNNILRLGTDITSDAEISAIAHGGTAGTDFRVYHNTIYIGGTSSTKNSYVLNKTGGGTMKLANNIFSNVRAGGAAKNEIYKTLDLGGVASSNNNLYQYNGLFANTTTAAVAEDYALLSDWNDARLVVSPTALSEDVNSKDQQNPLFTDATATTPDMHVPASSSANENGIAIAAVTDDFAGAVRANYVAEATKADMGAYAISNSTAVETAKQLSDLSVYGINNNIRFTNLSGKSASVYSFAGQLLKSVQLTSDNVTVSAAKGLYLVNVNGEVTKVMVK